MKVAGQPGISSVGLQVCCVVVRDVNAELLFKSHDQLDEVQRVGPEIVYEASSLDHLVLGDSQLLAGDLLHSI